MSVQHHKEDDTLAARSLKQFLQAVKTPPSRSTVLVAVILLLVAVLVGSWFYFTASATAASSHLWLMLDQTSGPGLEAFARDANQRGTVQARFAEAEAARRLMRWTEVEITRIDGTKDKKVMDTVALLGSDLYRDKAVEQIDKARSLYEKLIPESNNDPALLQESLMGAAKTNEILGDLDKAHLYYVRLKDSYPKTVLGQEAARRVEALDNPDSKKEIADLAALYVQKPK